MKPINKRIEAIDFAPKDGPDVQQLQDIFNRTHSDLDYYFSRMRDNYYTRHNYWAGKTHDLRKHGADAFPWEGASDTEVQLTEEAITKYVALSMNALRRMPIKATPVGSDDMGRAKQVSDFLKYMRHEYVPDFEEQADLAAQNFYEKGMMVTFTGWMSKAVKSKTTVTLMELNQQSPELVEKILAEDYDKQLIGYLVDTYQGMTKKSAQKVLNELRKNGMAEVSTITEAINRPYVKTLVPDVDVYCPSNTTDVESMPYFFIREIVSTETLRNRVITDEYNEAWVEKTIETKRGINTRNISSQYEGLSTIGRYEEERTDDDSIELIHMYQKLIDKTDGSMGVYLTVFHRDSAPEEYDEQQYAWHGLLPATISYPITITSMQLSTKVIYDTTSIPQLMRGAQQVIKVERDQRIDAASMSILPPLTYKNGRKPLDWRPGGMIPRSRPDDYTYADTPSPNLSSERVEQVIKEQAERTVGLSETDLLSKTVQQYYVQKFLSHTARVLKKLFIEFKKYGPEEVFFQVTGNPNPITFQRGERYEDYSVMIDYDAMLDNPEQVEKRAQLFMTLLQYDRTGRIDVEKLISYISSGIDPNMADAVLVPSEQGSQKIIEDVISDLTAIKAGIEVGARKQGAQLAMQQIQTFMQQPDVAQEYAQNEAFRNRLDKYMQQYQFQMQQMQNAQIGRIGTEPAANLQNNV